MVDGWIVVDAWTVVVVVEGAVVVTSAVVEGDTVVEVTTVEDTTVLGGAVVEGTDVGAAVVSDTVVVLDGGAVVGGRVVAGRVVGGRVVGRRVVGARVVGARVVATCEVVEASLLVGVSVQAVVEDGLFGSPVDVGSSTMLSESNVTVLADAGTRSSSAGCSSATSPAPPFAPLSVCTVDGLSLSIWVATTIARTTATRASTYSIRFFQIGSFCTGVFGSSKKRGCTFEMAIGTSAGAVAAGVAARGAGLTSTVRCSGSASAGSASAMSA